MFRFDSKIIWWAGSHVRLILYGTVSYIRAWSDWSPNKIICSVQTVKYPVYSHRVISKQQALFRQNRPKGLENPKVWKTMKIYGECTKTFTWLDFLEKIIIYYSDLMIRKSDPGDLGFSGSYEFCFVWWVNSNQIWFKGRARMGLPTCKLPDLCFQHSFF